MLESPIAKPFAQFTPFFIATGLLKTIQTNTAQQNQVLQSPILNCLLTWGIINRVGRCLHANSTKKTA